MVVSSLNGRCINSAAVVGSLNESSHLENSGMRWGSAQQTDSPTGNEQSNCQINFIHRVQQSHSPIQAMEENSCYSSENGIDNTSGIYSPRQEISRSSSSEDNSTIGAGDRGVQLFPISGAASSMMQQQRQQCLEYSNSDNESSQASPSSFNEEDAFMRNEATGTTTTTTRNGPNGGKMKVHKCRSCGFTTTNKHESWLHIAIHMKPEKILRCPDCPFVTEYKHHLDFHVWNHQGMKPYKCDKCPYVCVNKSMLKSHLKSHSNVYQYRCANCAYRTKYCHSLKIHLRKYRHEPGVVLDSEGHPNPNPVIDVYGNRRGPKQRSKKQDTSSTLPQVQPSLGAQLNPYQSFPWMNNIFFRNEENSAALPCASSMPPLLNRVAATKFEEFALKLEPNISDECKNNLIFNNNLNNISINNNNNDNSQLNLQSCLSDKESQQHSNANKILLPNNYNGRVENYSPPTTTAFPSLYDRLTPNAEADSSSECVPLNLCLTTSTPSTAVGSSNDNNNSSASKMPSVKNRRKGIACKLKRSYLGCSEEDEHEPEIRRTESKSPVESTYRSPDSDRRSSDYQIPPLEQQRIMPKDTSPTTIEDSADERGQSVFRHEDVTREETKSFFYCKHCEISFFNQVMFTMHMGYHGFADPFTCNRCGKKTENNIGFYAHMITAPHS